MSQPARFTGRPVSEGTAAGRLYAAAAGPPADATAEQVREAFAAVASDRHDLAERLRGAGRAAEADIIGVAALIAADPALVGPAVTAVAGGTDAATAVTDATEAQAAVLAGLAVPEMAERAGDVRQVGRAVIDHLAAAGAPPRPAGDFILVRREVSPADLIELARDVAQERQLATERHTIRVEGPEPPLVGLWDERRLGRVLANLLDNAVKYSPDGGPIDVRLQREGDWVAIDVTDQGIGIPDEDKPRIFERFQRASNVEQRIGGTGIGLASVRHIVDSHGGSITVRSQEGSGTTFTVRLPIGLE